MERDYKDSHQASLRTDYEESESEKREVELRKSRWNLNEEEKMQLRKGQLYRMMHEYAHTYNGHGSLEYILTTAKLTTGLYA